MEFTQQEYDNLTLLSKLHMIRCFSDRGKIEGLTRAEEEYIREGEDILVYQRQLNYTQRNILEKLANKYNVL